MNNLSEKIASGTLWRLGERIGASLVTFVVSVVLLRRLDPDEYGVMGIVLIITAILEVFADSGFGKALIQKKDATDEDFSTIFIFNVFICFVLYGLLYFAAPLIERFYSVNGLTAIVRVSGTLVLISGFKNVVQSYIMRNMQFRLFFRATLVGTVLSGVVALIMAYSGMGVWALVAQLLVNPFVDTILLWVEVKWRPQLRFSRKSLHELFSYGWKLLAIDVVDKIFNNLRALLVGKFYSTADLGFYDTGRKLPNAIYTNLDSSIRSVIFPVFSAEQEDLDAVKQHMLKTIRICTFLTTPVLFGLAACAENVIVLLYTEKWLNATPFMQVACIVWALNSIQAMNQQVILSLGRSDITLKQEMLIKCVSLATLIVAVRISVLAIALSQLAVTIIGLFINLAPNRKLIRCGYIEQFKACAMEFLLSAFMAVCVFAGGKLPVGRAVQLVYQVVTGVVIYVGASHLLKLESYTFLLELAKEKVRVKKK